MTKLRLQGQRCEFRDITEVHELLQQRLTEQLVIGVRESIVEDWMLSQDKSMSMIGIADDVGVFGKDEQQHDENLRHLMRTASQHGLFFNSIKTYSLTLFGLHFDKMAYIVRRTSRFQACEIDPTDDFTRFSAGPARIHRYRDLHGTPYQRHGTPCDTYTRTSQEGHRLSVLPYLREDIQ